MLRLVLVGVLVAWVGVSGVQGPGSGGQPAPPPVRRALPQVTQDYISVDAPVVVLQHVRVIDGTGAPAVEDQTVVIEGADIKAIGPSASLQAPAGARVLDLAGRSVMPGWVAMHEHLFYTGATGQGRVAGAPEYYPTMVYSFPRLYLAHGVTSMRTAGSMEPYADLEVKRYIDAGRIPGPKMHLTGPYLTGAGAYLLQLHALQSPEEASKMVNYWADLGFTSFKAYTQITRAQLGAAIRTAHGRGLKVTGHLCSVTFREAADLGIDSLEHGISAATDFVPGKKPDECPARGPDDGNPPIDSPDVQGLIKYLVGKKVAIDSTLPVFEAGVSGRLPEVPRFWDSLSPLAQADYRLARARGNPAGAASLRRSMDFEVAFVRAGGTLMAGLDPTGNGGAIAGYGDQREVELLVEAGFTPLEAIHIQTENGATFLGERARVGTLKAGKRADLTVVKGDPSRTIADIENVEYVFKDGKGYDPKTLIDSVRGMVGSR
jgi:imidazolonepropionase-like amidohydrolase